MAIWAAGSSFIIVAQNEAPPKAPSGDIATWEYRVDRVSANHVFTEGPVWSPEGWLYFSDVPNNRIHRFVPGKGTNVFREESNGANGNTIDAQGRLLSCESRTRRVTRTDLKTGKIEVLAETFEGKRFNAPNDIVARKDGFIWFTDPAFGDQADKREMDYYGVYRIAPKGELTLVTKMKGRPNGVTLSPNGRILYVADTDERKLRAWDLDRQANAANERVLIEGIDGPPDGIRTDEKGNLYITANQLAIYSPAGKLIRSLPFAETPRNVAFGDPDYQSIYVTSYTSVFRLRWPIPGARF